jgi:hypothetical protein
MNPTDDWEAQAWRGQVLFADGKFDSEAHTRGWLQGVAEATYLLKSPITHWEVYGPNDYHHRWGEC